MAAAGSLGAFHGLKAFDAVADDPVPSKSGQSAQKSPRGQVGKQAGDQTAPSHRNHCVFSKPLTSMPPSELASWLEKVNLGGVECPIRRGGRIDPTRVEDELPVYVEALAARDRRVVIMATDINDPDDPLTERVLRTAAALGVTHYRMRYFKYRRDTPIRDQIATFRDQMIDLAALNHQFGMQGLYQNHAGKDYFGGAIWDLDRGLDGIEPDQIGVAYDLRHAAVEGTNVWRNAFRIIRDRVRTFYVKDFTWKDGRVVNAPLGEGMTDGGFYADLTAAERGYPISLHEEYLDHRKAELVPQHLQAFENDYRKLRTWLAESAG